MLMQELGQIVTPDKSFKNNGLLDDRRFLQCATVTHLGDNKAQAFTAKAWGFVRVWMESNLIRH